MGADLYRDANVGIRARLAELDARIRARETELTDAFWSNLEPYVRERLAHLRSALALIGADSLDKLARAEALLSAYAEELDAWVARAPALSERWRVVPVEVADPPPVPESGPQLAASEGHALLRAFRDAVREAIKEVEVVEEGWWSSVARFRWRDAPFVLRASALATRKGQLRDVAMQLVTSVARAAPRLLVKHDSLLASFRKAMGWRREVEIGDASFDGLFVIQGACEAARHVLVPKVRSSLLALARFDVPTLEIEPWRRTASLSWFFEPHASAIEAAVRTLAGVREIPSFVSFRR